MISINEAIGILENGELAFKFVIVIGIVLIIIAVAPSMSIPVLKIPMLTLNKKQSMILGAIGGILILSGMAGLSSNNVPPIIVYQTIEPNLRNTTVLQSGIPVRIYVSAEDPDGYNIIQKFFFQAIPLQYDFLVKGPGTNNTLQHFQGPDVNNIFVLEIDPSYAGRNEIWINVTDRPPGMTKPTSGRYIILVDVNRQPTLERIIPNKESPQPVNSRIKITAEATDPENDKLYYQFLRMPQGSTSFSIVQQNWSEENELYWIPTEDDIGENVIKACVRDGLHEDQKDAYKTLQYEING